MNTSLHYKPIMAQARMTQFFTSGSSSKKRNASDSSDGDESGTPEKKKPKPPGFCEEWLEKYVWLFVENGKMKCHPCLSIKQNNPFSTSCTNFRNSDLTRHQKSASHVEALRGVKLQSDIKKSIKKAETEKIKL